MRQYETRPLHVEEVRRSKAVGRKKAAATENRAAYVARAEQVGETPERREARLERKSDRNAARHQQRQAYLAKTGNDRVYARLSWRHPDYGLSPQEHEAQKAQRAAGKIPFVDKGELGRRRGGLARSMGL